MIAWGLGLLSVAIAFSSAQGQGTGPVTPTTKVDQSPLDQPLGWLHDAKRNYAVVKDYTCTLVSHEKVRGVLQDESIMYMKMKSQPYSIYMKWIAPKKYQGQEVAFVLGKNNNKMRVKSNVVLAKKLGFMSIDPNDPRVLEHSRHNILEAGIGNMIEQTIKYWTVERAFDKSQVKTGEYMYNQRNCIRVEVTRTEANPNFPYYRTVLYLDKDSKLPIRVENYEWARPGGPAEGDLAEMFSYVNLQFNVGLKDDDFNK
jgi:hypothetical protein